MRQCIAALVLFAALCGGFAQERNKVNLPPLFPGMTWEIETATGTMTFEHLRNDYGDELTLPYKKLAFSSATLYVDSKNLFHSKTTVNLGFIDRPIDMAWSVASDFYDSVQAAEIDFKWSPDFFNPFYSHIRPYIGYNYQNYLMGNSINSSSLAYFGYHDIQAGIESTIWSKRWLRVYGYFGIAPILISGVIKANPFFTYGGSLFFFFWRLRIGLTYAGKYTPAYLFYAGAQGFKMSEIGLSVYIRLQKKTITAASEN